MWSCRSRSASSMKGLLSASSNVFQRLPSRLLISALCMSGCTSQIFLRSICDHTMNAFIGRFMWFGLFFFVLASEYGVDEFLLILRDPNCWVPKLAGLSCCWGTIFVPYILIIIIIIYIF
ncbi:GSCOCG00003836001-RA-CDS [Cotesia congregata]|nr:GSCOCG00003836001-RA-CDS [Cotesia congregata]